MTPRVRDMAAACPVSATVSQVGPDLYVMYPEPSAQISATVMEPTALRQASAAVTLTGWAPTAPRVCSHQPFSPSHLLTSQAVLQYIVIFHFHPSTLSGGIH